MSLVYSDTGAGTHQAAAVPRTVWFVRTRRAFMHAWRFLLGVLFCQTLLGAVVAVGWTYAWMQRTAVRRWWRMSGLGKEGGSLAAFLTANPKTMDMVHPPTWFANPTGLSTEIDRTWRTTVNRLLGGLWRNARTGVQAVVNTSIITLPACALWVFAWYAGWDNSFNKGYEQAPVGPITGFSGVGLFIAAMLYLPMAQVRQAVSGDWRTFYQFRLNWRLMRACWLPMLVLAGLYAAVSIPVHAFRIFPYFWHNDRPDILEMTATQQVELLNNYYFWATIPIFALFVFVRIAATRIYASGVVNALQRDRVQLDELSPFERRTLERLGLAVEKPASNLPRIVRAVVGGSTRIARAGSMLALIVVWFMFTAQIFVAQFINYQPFRGWVNQPLVHTPWLKFVPDHVKDAANSD